MGEAPERSPLDPFAAGWFIRPRALRGWPLYQSLSAEGRHVVDTLFELAAWKPREAWFASQRIVIERGELIDSEEEIARAAGTTRKVVRGVIGKLEDGNFLRRRRVHPSGRCPHVITILDYERSQDIATEEGPRAEQPPGLSEANNGARERARERAPSEQKERSEPKKQQPPRGKWPASSALADALSERWAVELQGASLMLPRQRRDEVEAAVEQLGLDDAIDVCVADVSAAFRRRSIGEPPASLGFFADTLITAARRRATTRTVATGAGA